MYQKSRCVFNCFAIILLVSQVNGDLQQDAEDLVAQLREVVQGSCDSGELRIRAHIEEIVIITQTYIDIAAGQITEELDKLFAEIKIIEESAFSAGVDVTNCISPVINQLYLIEDSVVVNLTNCINAESTSLQYSVSRATRSLAEIMSSIGRVETQLQQCGTAEDSERCFINVIGQVPTLMNDLPSRVVGVVDGAIAQTEAAKVRFERCAILPIETVILEGEEIVNEIQDCVKNLIDG